MRGDPPPPNQCMLREFWHGDDGCLCCKQATADRHTSCSFSETTGSCASAPNIADHLVLFADQQACERLPR
jgi:hypothetical protein